MSLRFILGRSGSGKTTVCLNEIVENNKNADSSLIYIVPEQFSIQSEKNILEKSGLFAIMDIHVLSFKRLAYYVFSETGLKAGKILEDTGKFILLRKIINELKNEFVYYENPNITKGFIEKIAETITEFYEYNISITELLENTQNNERLALKIKDLGLIYNKFLEYLGENYISTDETLDILAEKIFESNFLENTEVWIDEFSAFTPQELNVIKALLAKVKRVNIALAIGENDIFSNTTKETKEKIIKIAQDLGVKVEPAKNLKTLYRYENSPELKFLETQYFNYSSKQYDEKNKRVKTYAAKNRYEEVVFLADYITYLVRENSWEYNDIAIITSDISLYENLIHPIFKLYDFSFFIDKNNDVLGSPLVELIRSLLGIYVGNWSTDSILRFLRTGMTQIPSEEIDVFENYIISYGIRGYKWEQSEWYYGFKQDKSIFDFNNIHEIKNKIMDMLQGFNDGIKLTKKLSVKDFSIKVYNFLAKINVGEKLNILGGQHLQIWDIVKSLFEKLVEIMGNVSMPIKEFAEILDAGFFSLNMGSIPTSQDRIIVGDLVRTRLSSIKAMFILGANEGLFPQIASEKGIFTDDERAYIKDTSLEIAPDSKTRMLFDNFTLYQALTKPEKLLVLSCSLSDTNGKSLFVSSTIQRINKLFIDSKITEEDRKIIEISSPNAMLERSIEKITKNEHDELTRWFLESQEYAPKIEKYISSKKKEILSQNAIETVYKADIKTSVSRIEKYLRCPFAYFVRHNLEAIEREEYRIKKLDLGNLFHDVLEEFSHLLQKDNIEWKNISKEQINFYAEEAFAIVQKELKTDLFFSDEKNAYTFARALKIAKRSIWALSEHIKSGNFKPYGDEVDFGGAKSQIKGISLEINENHKFSLTGRIDRIDTFEYGEKSYIKIIDYKSGNKEFKLKDVENGMQLQLLVYMKSILENGKDIIKADYKIMPGGVLYFKINDPIINIDYKNAKKDIEGMILEKFKMSGLVLSDENVISALDGDGKALPSKGFRVGYEEFLEKLELAASKVKEAGERIISGDISANPFEEEDCSWCNYNNICKFEGKK
ncbi:MAG: exodeoxyribonuclease V subunit gamma [Defluviitaleaceae bacterium]|nr:exodeoxyribonuclease V subunit gamma [Defluviitaleaceae bacterium]